MAGKRRDQMGHKMSHNIAGMMGSNTLWLGISTVFCGAGAAAVNHQFDWVMLILLLLFTVLIQSTGNCLHHYTEIKRQSGHVKSELVIEDMSPLEVYKVSYTCFTIMAITVGITMMAIAGWWLIFFGAAVWLLMWLMYYRKSALVASPYAILVTFLLFGPIGVIGSCFALMPDAINAMDESLMLRPALWMSCISGLMAASCNLLYNYFSYKDDMQQHRRTYSTVTSLEFTRYSFLIFGLIITALLVLMAYDLPMVPDYCWEWWVLIVVAVVFTGLRIYIFERMPRTNKTFLGDMRLSVNMMLTFISAVLMIVLICVGYLE